ncbi:hypothetical protein [Streptomyces sp. NPDC091278]|uniref:hypothetical protein n=1 Tax=Streptomyces sp. NPDC091278 TaxID=3155301 RepID=UPI00344DE5A9
MVFHSAYGPVPAVSPPIHGAVFGGAAVTTVQPPTAPRESAGRPRDSAARWTVTVSPCQKVRAVESIDGVLRAAPGKILRRELRDREARDRT